MAGGLGRLPYGGEVTRIFRLAGRQSQKGVTLAPELGWSLQCPSAVGGTSCRDTCAGPAARIGFGTPSSMSPANWPLGCSSSGRHTHDAPVGTETAPAAAVHPDRDVGLGNPPTPGTCSTGRTRCGWCKHKSRWRCRETRRLWRSSGSMRLAAEGRSGTRTGSPAAAGSTRPNAVASECQVAQPLGHGR